MFKKNDIVVYRGEVCKIVGKQRSDFTGEQCYIMIPFFQQDGSVRHQVPVANKGGHLRNLVTKEEIQQLIESTPDIEMLENKPANMKSQYAALLKSEDLKDLICIIKTSFARNKARLDSNKRIASIDDEYMHRAEKFLFNEISIVMGMDYDQAKQYFETEVAKIQNRTGQRPSASAD